MVPVFVFTLHIIFATIAFTRSYQRHGWTDAFMILAFIAIIFSVGWTIAGFIVRFFAPPGGIHPWYDNDSLSLSIVTVLEAVLFFFYFTEKKRKARSAA